jgi:chitosanase
MPTHTQTLAAQAIVNIFETSSVRGDYGKVTLIAGDTGHLTYGRSQTTLGSGNLATLLERYCAAPGARFSKLLKPSLPACKAKDFKLDHDERFKNILRACGDDPVMRDTQDAFFTDVYWSGAEKSASKLGFTLPLSCAVVFDSHVHGSWTKIRDTVNKKGAPEKLGEKKWIKAYVAARRDWLANHPRDDLRATVYRMDAFQRLIDHDLWSLEMPFVVRGLEVNEDSLKALPPGCYAGPAAGSRNLAVQAPLMRGLDVRLFQLALSLAGVDVLADGIFGKGSVTALQAWQKKTGKPASTIVGADLVGQLARKV